MKNIDIRSALVALAVLSYVSVAGASEELELLCQKKPVELNSIRQVRLLANELVENPEVACRKSVKAALLDILPVIEDEDACSENKYNQIKKFRDQYLNKHITHLPQPLRRFFVAYGLKVSEICKDQMAKLLLKDSVEVKEHIDGFKLSQMVNKQVEKSFGQTLDHKHPILIYSIKTIAKMDEVNRASIVSKMAMVIKQNQEICRKKLEPYYRPLILPVSKLAGLGFDYKSDSFDELSNERQEELSQWYGAVLACECIKALKVVELVDEDEPETLITVLRYEEYKLARPVEDSNEIVNVTYSTPSVFLTEDKVLDESDHDLAAAIDGIKLSLSKKHFLKGIALLMNKLSKFVNEKKVKYGLRDKRSKSLIRSSLTKILKRHPRDLEDHLTREQRMALAVLAPILIPVVIFGIIGIITLFVLMLSG